MSDLLDIYRLRLAKLQVLTMDLPDDFYTRLLRIRGGCRCSYPGVLAPCSPCEDVITDAEANEILSELALELPVTEVLRIQTILIENDYDGTIDI